MLVFGCRCKIMYFLDFFVRKVWINLEDPLFKHSILAFIVIAFGFIFFNRRHCLKEFFLVILLISLKVKITLLLPY